MQNTLLKNIIDQSCIDLRGLALGGEEDILSALHRATAEAELQETKPKFNLSFTIAIDPDKGNFETKLSWTVKQTLSAEHTIDDAGQEKLRLDDTTIEMVGPDGKSTGPVPLKKFTDAVEKLSGKKKCE